MHTLQHSVPPTLEQATTDPCLCWRLLDTHGHVWISFLWGHCSFLLGPGAHKVLFVPSKNLFPQSCVSSGCSMVRLMATSFKRAYAIPGLFHPEHLWQSTADPYPHKRHSDSSGSVSVSLACIFVPSPGLSSSGNKVLASTLFQVGHAS